MAKYIQGLNKDTGLVDQPEGTYRYAKNALVSKTTGAIVNEHGTTAHVSVGVDQVVIGTIEITDGRIVIFTVGETDTSISGNSSKRRCTYYYFRN